MKLRSSDNICRKRKKYISRRYSQIGSADGRREKISVNQREKISVDLREKKIRKLVHADIRRLKYADGRRKKTCAIVQNFVEGLKSSFRFIP